MTNTKTNLMGALCAAMAEMRDPVKRSQNPHFKSRFADLREVLVLRHPAPAGAA